MEEEEEEEREGRWPRGLPLLSICSSRRMSLSTLQMRLERLRSVERTVDRSVASSLRGTGTGALPVLPGAMATVTILSLNHGPSHPTVTLLSLNRVTLTVTVTVTVTLPSPRPLSPGSAQQLLQRRPGREAHSWHRRTCCSLS